MSTQVRQMFDDIAPSYDRVNSVLSFGVHHRWRKALVREAGFREGDRLLDCATGTGDLAIELKRHVGPSGSVTGTDFSAEMLRFAPSKAKTRGVDVTFEQADVLQLPYPNDAFDGATIAFGIRNVSDVSKALREMARVVKPGGAVAVLEFGQPGGLVFGPAYRTYSRYIMPAVGGLLSGNRAAYRYLPETAAAFPAGEAFTSIVEETSAYDTCKAKSLWGGIAYVYVGKVAKESA